MLSAFWSTSNEMKILLAKIGDQSNTFCSRIILKPWIKVEIKSELQTKLYSIIILPLCRWLSSALKSLFMGSFWGLYAKIHSQCALKKDHRGSRKNWEE